jgi:transposase
MPCVRMIWPSTRVSAWMGSGARKLRPVVIIGIDETSCAKGQHYITLVHDLKQARLIYATPGKDASTVERFVGDFKTHKGKPEAIEVVCMDMSRAFIAGAAEHLPAAAVAFDGFHVVQLANRALDAVRREEARGEHWLKKTRWCWLKDMGRWTPKERDDKQNPAGGRGPGGAGKPGLPLRRIRPARRASSSSPPPRSGGCVRR